MADEEAIVIRINKKVIEEIRRLKPEWQAVNATVITDMVLRTKLEELRKEAQK